MFAFFFLLSFVLFGGWCYKGRGQMWEMENRGVQDAWWERIKRIKRKLKNSEVQFVTDCKNEPQNGKMAVFLLTQAQKCHAIWWGVLLIFRLKLHVIWKGRDEGQRRGIHMPCHKHRGPSQPPMCALAVPSVLAFEVLRIFSSSPRSAGMTDTRVLTCLASTQVLGSWQELYSLSHPSSKM